MPEATLCTLESIISLSGTMFKDYHIIIIPKEKQKTKTFQVSGFTLKVILLTVVLAIPLFLISVLSTIHYQNKLVSLKRNNYENSQLIQNRNELIARLTKLENSMNIMDDSIAHLGELMDVDPQSLSFGTGPIADLDVSLFHSDSAQIPNADVAINEWLEENGELTVNKFDKKINRFKEETGLLNKKLEEIFKQNKDKIRFVNASPSVLPVQGWITSEFGIRKHPIAHRYRMHNGVDIASPVGTMIKAPASGKVVFSGRESGYGNVILIDHGYGVVTMYAHLNRIYVKQGVQVKRDDLLGEVGSTGSTTGPHLHYEVHVDGMPSDPLAFVVE